MNSIAVIIPTRNRVRYLPQALASVQLQQGDFDLSIIVVDDGSTDETAQFLDMKCREDRRIVRLSGLGAGPSAARNIGILSALDCDMLTFLDDDDVMLEGRLEGHRRILDGSPSAQYAFGRALISETSSADTPLVVTDKMLDVAAPSLSAGLFRSRFFTDVGLLDESLHACEDLELYLRAAAMKVSFKQDKLPCIIYRKHGGNMTDNTRRLLHWQAKVILRHKPASQNDNRSHYRPRFDLQALRMNIKNSP